MKPKNNNNEDDKKQKKENINLMDLQIPQGPAPMRSLGLFGNLDEEQVEDVCSGLLYLKHTAITKDVLNPEEGESAPKPINFYVSTWGGDALGMFGIYDLMRVTRETCPIHTFGLGKVMSAGVLLLAAGTKGQRKVGKHTRIMMHSVRGGHIGNIHSLENEMNETRYLQNQHIEALVEETKLTKRKLNNMLSKKVDVYIGAEEAIKMGIADIIV